MTIKAIIFDFGQVLNAPVDPTAEEARRGKLAGRLRLSAEALWPHLFEGEAARRWMTGRLDWDGFWTEVLAPAGIVDPAEIAAFAQSVFAGGDSLHPEMVALLAELRARGEYRLAVLSNASWTEEELARLLVEKYGLPKNTFDAVITSTSVGVVKPEPAIFWAALYRLGVRPEETIFADDLPSFAQGAAALGIHAFTFTTPADFRRFLRRHGVAVAAPAVE
jgi:putative hydrolase of the HAD superfamily